MSAKSFLVKKSVKKQLRRLPPHVHRKVIASLSLLKDNPIAGAKLSGELAGYYKFRVGDYRIVYSFDIVASTLTVVKIEHRQGVYK